MRSHRWTTVCFVAFLLALHGTISSAEPKIGHTTDTKNKAEGIFNGNVQDLSKGSEVFSNEIVRTGPDSIAGLRFLDKSILTVGPISEVNLDTFVYDPNGSSGAVVIQATRGAFRFITGTQDKKAYEVRTPLGTLGIRG